MKFYFVHSTIYKIVLHPAPDGAGAAGIHAVPLTRNLLRVHFTGVGLLTG